MDTNKPAQNLNDISFEKDVKAKQEQSSRILFKGLIAFLISGFALGYIITRPKILSELPKKIIQGKKEIVQSQGIKKFTSEEEFKTYLESIKDQVSPFGLGMGVLPKAGRGFGDVGITAPQMELDFGSRMEGMDTERVSETNVQVIGIDEPDIVKTDGEQIYFSSQGQYIRPMPEPIMGMPIEDEMSLDDVKTKTAILPRYQSETTIIKAFPPGQLAKKAGIEKQGNLLLFKNNLVIFSGNFIHGFDVSDPSNPQEKWKQELESKNRLVDSRLYNNKIYMIISTNIDRYKPCPIMPLKIGGNSINVRCMDIYHPIAPVSTDVTFTAMIVDPKSGQVEKTASLVGSSGQSIIYMSQNAIYLTYSYNPEIISFLYKFYEEEGKDLISSSALEKLKKLKDYDISNQSKMIEFETILQEYQNSLSDDERLKMENELTNRMKDYFENHMREMELTEIVKIDNNNLEVKATGAIPGRPLNQFSLDEYKGHLRLASTVSGGMFGGGAESANDLYVLDGDLKTVGSVINLGLGERIYSARFIEDKGYLVTFRQTDPFYVFDLSNPKNPEKKGELKIPGYSSYLHPLVKDEILGVGMEGSQVKLALFNVSSPENPKEQDKYMLSEHWSEISQTHHAFLQDSKHSVFFMPASQGGYIFSYKGSKFELLKAVANIRAKRAVYINDYLYIIGEDKLIVLNEQDWEEVNQLEL